MTALEKRNYLLAVFISIIFHLLLIIIYIPQSVFQKKTTLDTYPVGMVEILPPPAVTEPVIPVSVKTVTPQSIPVSTKPVAKKDQKPVIKPPPQPTPKVENRGQSTPEIARATPDKSSSGGPGGESSTPVITVVSLGTGEGKVSEPGILPPYPKNAMNEGKEGEVAVKILVRADGSLENIILVRSSNEDSLDRAALNSIKRSWRFKPETKDYYIDLVFSFSIKSGVSIRYEKSETRP